MTENETTALARIEQKVDDMDNHLKENCARHAKQIEALYDKTNSNSFKIAWIMGVGAAVVFVGGLIVTLVT